MSPEKKAPEDIYSLLDKDWERFQRKNRFKRPDLLPARIIRRLARRGGFISKEAEARYNQKIKRVHTAAALGVPDRVPVITSGLNFYPARLAGVSMADYCNDRHKCRDAFFKFLRENQDFDAVFPSHQCAQGAIIKLTGLDILALPGVDLPENVPFQFLEKERLAPEEYQDLLEGGFDFFKKTVVPRMTDLYDPEKGWGRERLVRILWENLSYGYFYVRLMDRVEKELGLPMDTGAFFFAPYDLLSFLFRGLSGISRDLFRQPRDVEQAADLMTSVVLKFYENVVTATGLNGGAILLERAFSLSPRQFARFYLPSLKDTVEGLLKRGVMPILALEGDCTHLLEFMLELPKGKTLINLDTSDIFKAKKLLSGHACLIGNVPMNMMAAKSPADVADYCKSLLKEVAPGGGFMMSGALGIPDNARPENVRAMVETTLEYGAY